MKKAIALLLMAAMLFSLAACSSGTSEKPADQTQPDTEGSSAAEPVSSDDKSPESSGDVKPVEITQFGYAMDGEYLFYAITLHNPNTDYVMELPSFRITARDASGSVVGTEEQTLSMIYPGQDFYIASQGCSCTSTPETVDVEMLPSEDYNITKVSQAEHPDYIPLTVVSSNMSNDSYSSRILGEIKNDNDYSIDSAIVTVFFRDAEGTLLAGELTFVDKVAAHGTAPFEINCYGGFETDSFEVYANIW